MDEKQYELMYEKAELSKTQGWKKIRYHQLEMIVNLAKNNYDEKEIRAMLKLIAKTDDWEKEYKKAQKNR